MAAPDYQLTVVSGPNPGKVFPLDKPELTVGRDLSNEIVINDAEVSRRHARLTFQPGGYLLEDLGSTNGSAVNGQRILSPYLLRPGEVISFGDHVTVVYESVVFDPDATQASASVRYDQPQGQYNQPQGQFEQPRARYEPPQEPLPNPVQSVPIAPPPGYAYSGSIPQGPVQEEVYQAPPARRRLPAWSILTIVAALVLICLCAGALWFIDSNYLWCSIPGLSSLLQGCP